MAFKKFTKSIQKGLKQEKRQKICSSEEVEHTISRTATVLTDKKAMDAIRTGEEARKQNTKDYYIGWDKVREL